MKKVEKFGAFTFGLGFCALQALSYSGYIKVNYNKISDDVKNLLDLNNDGDVDEKDGQRLYTKLMEILTYNIQQDQALVLVLSLTLVQDKKFLISNFTNFFIKSKV